MLIGWMDVFPCAYTLLGIQLQLRRFKARRPRNKNAKQHSRNFRKNNAKSLPAVLNSLVIMVHLTCLHILEFREQYFFPKEIGQIPVHLDMTSQRVLPNLLEEHLRRLQEGIDKHDVLPSFVDLLILKIGPSMADSMTCRYGKHKVLQHIQVVAR